MTELLQKLTNRIDELLDGEIKELKFGCLVNTKFTHDCGKAIFNPKGKPTTSIVNNRRIVKLVKEYCPDRIGMMITYFFDDSEIIRQYSENGEPFDIEILGRPITLEYILLVMDIVTAERKPEAHPVMYIGSGRAIISIQNIAGYVNNVKVIWFLGKILSEQSEKTKEAIAEILGVK